MKAATRASPLARVQTGQVAYLLNVAHEQARSVPEAGENDAASGQTDADAGPDAERAYRVLPVTVETSGDRQRGQPIAAIGGQGVFVKEVQAAVLDGRAHFAVHSAKDLPSGPTDGLVLAAFPPRGDPRDALVGSTLADLAPGARVATGSVRRRAQLAALRPDVDLCEIRGNIDTRLAKARDFDAILLAVAGLDRLARGSRIAEVLEPSVMLPQVGQGALAVECRAGDLDTIALLATVDDRTTRLAVEAERSFLAEVGGGCELPVGALAHVTDDGEIVLEALLASLDGSTILRHRATGRDQAALGRAVARHLLDGGGGELMEAARR